MGATVLGQKNNNSSSLVIFDGSEKEYKFETFSEADAFVKRMLLASASLQMIEDEYKKLCQKN